jgi:hypothetical protein
VERKEFFLAVSIFAVMSVVGVGFSLWYVGNYAPATPGERVPVTAQTEKGTPGADREVKSMGEAAEQQR